MTPVSEYFPALVRATHRKDKTAQTALILQLLSETPNRLVELILVMSDEYSVSGMLNPPDLATALKRLEPIPWPDNANIKKSAG